MGRFLMTKRGLNNVLSEEESSQIPSDLNEAIAVESKKEPKRMAGLETKIYQSRIPTFYAEKTLNEIRNTVAVLENEESTLEGTPEEVAEVIMITGDILKENKDNTNGNLIPKKTLQHNKSGSSIPRKSFGENTSENRGDNQLNKSGSSIPKKSFGDNTSENRIFMDNQHNKSGSSIPRKSIGENPQQSTNGNRSFSENRQNKSASSIPRRSFGEQNTSVNRSFSENQDNTRLIPGKSIGENQQQNTSVNKSFSDNQDNTSGRLIPRKSLGENQQITSPKEDPEKIQGIVIPKKSVELNQEDAHENFIPKKSLKRTQGTTNVGLISGGSPKRNQDIIHDDLVPKKPVIENTSANKTKSLIPKKSLEEKQENTNSLVQLLILKKAMEENQEDKAHGSLIPRKTSEKANATDLSPCNFCGEKLLFVERVCAEGKSFHRACFRCNYCNIPLRYLGCNISCSAISSSQPYCETQPSSFHLDE